MTLSLYADNSDENISIYLDIFLVICKYAELTYGREPALLEAVKTAAKEVMDKLIKVGEQKKTIKATLAETVRLLERERQKGGDAVATHKLSGDIENFLAQGKGALDLLANKLLRQVVAYDGKFNHEKIVTHLKAQPGLDPSIVGEIEALLNRDWDVWLKAFVYDRDWHHEENFKLSDMKYVEGQPTVILERRDGTKIGNLREYVDIHWDNLIGLISDLVWLIFSAKTPAFKAIRVTRDMFMSPAEMAAYKKQRVESTNKY